MPVSVDDLLAGRVESDLRAGGRPTKVLKFLRKNAKKAYNATELSKEFDTDHRTMRSVLARLYNRGLIEKRDDYWFALAPEDSAHKRLFFAKAKDLDDRLGPERKEDWPTVPQPDD